MFTKITSRISKPSREAWARNIGGTVIQLTGDAQIHDHCDNGDRHPQPGGKKEGIGLV